MYGIIVLAMLLLSEGISEKVKYATSALSGLTCQLPSCFNGDSIPGNLHPDETPQFVIISFDDAVNDLNKDFYERLFTEGRVNPSGCPIAATFFVSHEWTDYSQVNHLYSQGHEISSHTVTHSHPTGFSEQRWTQEISGQAVLLDKLANVDEDDILGFRAPFLQTGGDRTFRALGKDKFMYDSSLPSQQTAPALWPYTLHKGIRQNCNVPPCPEDPHHGVWEVPMTTMLDGRGGKCPMLDACTYEENVDSIQRMLTRNFLRHYTDDIKPPFPMSYHAAWFKGRQHREEALIKFIDSILELPDVYIVTYQNLLRWIQLPTPLPLLSRKHASSCKRRTVTQGCKRRVCNYDHRTLVSCGQCPTEYPWIK